MVDPVSSPGLLSLFRSEFGGPARLFRAPARFNIIGEHTDYNDGFVFPANVALYTWLAVAPRRDRKVRVHAADFGQTVELDLDHLRKNPDGGWQEYPKGVMHVLQEHGLELRGADLLLAGEIPVGGGLSSSASIETAVAFAMLSISDHEIDRSALALMCREAENHFVGVSCGIMDQYVIALCGPGHAMLLDCRSLDYELVPLPADAQVLIVNSHVRHSLSEGGFNTRQQECARAVALLGGRLPDVTALRDVDPAQLDAHRGELGDLLYRRARHVVSENRRVHDALQAMVNNDPATLGRLMNESHDSLKDDYQVSCGELDALVGISRSCDGVYGSRMVGAGFGGCTVTLVDRQAIERVTGEVCRRYGELLGRDPWYHVVESSGPVHELSPA